MFGVIPGLPLSLVNFFKNRFLGYLHNEVIKQVSPSADVQSLDMVELFGFRFISHEDATKVLTSGH